MEHDFWLQRWREGRVGFHQATVSPLLQRHWPNLGLAAGSRVFVPLAGKSLDMIWLAELGHPILGVELSPLAVQQFFADNRLHPTVHQSRHGTHHVAGPIEIICGDVFGLDAQVLADCGGVYDRAALIALPAVMRKPYVNKVYGRLPVGCRGLLLTLEYDQDDMDGPPFSVPEHEVREHFVPLHKVELLERQGVPEKKSDLAARGLTRMATAAYRLHRQPA